MLNKTQYVTFQTHAKITISIIIMVKPIIIIIISPVRNEIKANHDNIC
jgi:hypothetical protein